MRSVRSGWLGSGVLADEMAWQHSLEDVHTSKGAVTNKVIDLVKELLGDSDAELGHFAKDSYDALEEAYGTPELKAQFAQNISDLGRRLVADFQQSMAEPLEALTARDPRLR